MSGIAKTIGKVFKKLKPIITTAITAVAIYYTVSAVAGSFTAPAAGAATTTGATTYSGGLAAAGAGAAPAAAGTTAAAVAPAAAAPTVAAGAGTVAAPTVASGTVAGSVAPAVTSSVAAGGAAPATGMMAWLKANPMATMMLGQGIAGAAGAVADEKAMERADEARKERGLMGFDYKGRPGSSGIVGRQVADPGMGGATVAPTTAAPIVSSQQVAPISQPIAQPGQGTPVPREKLPELMKSGQLT